MKRIVPMLLLAVGMHAHADTDVRMSGIQEAPVVWLPHHLGYAGASIAQLLILGGVAIWLWRSHRTQGIVAAGIGWTRRWPAATGGLLVAFIAVLSYFRLGPLGVTAELGSIARTAGSAWLPARLEGLDRFSGCATVIKQTLWSQNGAFVASVILGAFGAALSAGDFKPRRPQPAEILRALLGGVLMGWGAMVALGCTVGVLLSGIMASALSGWVFAVFKFGGLWLGWKARKKWSWI